MSRSNYAELDALAKKAREKLRELPAAVIQKMEYVIELTSVIMKFLIKASGGK